MDFNKSKALKFKPLAKINVDDLPEPLMWHVIVQPFIPEEQTTGGLYITESDQDDYKKTHCLCKVLKMGELCFKTDAFKGTTPFQVGDIVVIARHSAMWMNWNGLDLGYVADDRMLMKVKESHVIDGLVDAFQSNQNKYED